jgi:hypothetical protein
MKSAGFNDYTSNRTKKNLKTMQFICRKIDK